MSKWTTIPLAPSSQQFSLRWITTLMVFLFTLAFLVAAFIHQTLHTWEQSQHFECTLEVPSMDSSNVQKVLNHLQTITGLERVNILNEKRVLNLLEPWIGSVEELSGLQLPILIDLKFNPNTTINYDELQNQLNTIMPGIHIEQHEQWQNNLKSMGSTVEWVSYGIAFLVALIVIATMLVSSKSSFLTQRELISNLRLLGGSPSFIARQFQMHAMRVAFKGSFWGVVLTLPILALFWVCCQFLPFFIMIYNPTALFYCGISLTFIPIFFTLLSGISVRLNMYRMLVKYENNPSLSLESIV